METYAADPLGKKPMLYSLPNLTGIQILVGIQLSVMYLILVLTSGIIKLDMK